MPYLGRIDLQEFLRKFAPDHPLAKGGTLIIPGRIVPKKSTAPSAEKPAEVPPTKREG